VPRYVLCTFYVAPFSFAFAGFTWHGHSHSITKSKLDNVIISWNVVVYMYYVYVLQSELDKSWYIGFSQCIENRLDEHNSGKNHSTRFRRPWKLIYYEAYLNKLDALGRERFLKSGSGHRFLRKQMIHYFSICFT